MYLSFSLSLQSNDGVTKHVHVSLVKGNPVQYRSCTRSCKLKKTSVYHCHCPPADGKATELREQARKPAAILNTDASGEGVVNEIFMLNKQVKVSFWAGLFCLVSNNGLIAQQDSLVLRHRNLNEVEVVEKVRPAVTREGTPVQMLNKSDMLRLGVQELSEAVKRFSGVTIKDYGGVGGLKTVSVRSLGAQHTAISYDGITISDAQSGQVDISRFSLDNVEQVLLSIGQADDIFQTARIYASAGALQIETSHPLFDDKKYTLEGQLKAGSFGYFNPSFRYGQKVGSKVAVTMHGDWLTADGDYPFTLVNGTLREEQKRLNSDINSWRGEANVYADLQHAGRLQVKAYYFDSERGLPGSVSLYNPQARERLWDRNFFTQTRYENKIGEYVSVKGLLKFNHAYNRYLDINNKYAGGRQDDRYTQKEYYASGALKYVPADVLSFSFASDFFVNTLDATIPESPYPTRYTSLSVLAAQYQNARITLTGSLLGTYITERVKTGDRPADRKRISPALSGSWRIWEEKNVRVRASFKDIFRVPTFNDLYYLRVGNTGLRPERATQYNVGLTWSGKPFSALDYLRFSADGYYNRVSDKIVVIPSLSFARMMNFGEVSIKGLDLNVEAGMPVSNKLSFQLAGTYTWQKAVDITDPAKKNYKHQIPYTPEHSGTASLTAETPWINVGYMLTAVGNRYVLPQNIRENRIEGYIEQGISANRTFKLGKASLRLQGEIINLGDINYEVIQYYPMPGRSFRVSLKINY